MNPLKSFLAVSFAVSAMFECNAQGFVTASDRIVPRWINRPPVSANHTISYVVVPVISTNLTGASTLSLNELVKYLPRDWNISGVEEFGSVSKIRRDNSGIERTKDEVIRLQLKAEGAPIDVECTTVDTYWKRMPDGNYQSYYLYQVAEPGQSPEFDETALTTSYGLSGLWRSAIIPGWGQFYKGTYMKGGLILGGCAAFVGGIVGVESVRADYVRKIGETHDVDYKRLYAKRADQFSTARNVLIGALGALYLYNLIDVVAAPGARRVIVNPKNGMSRRSLSWKVYPSMPDNQSVALAVGLTF